MKTRRSWARENLFNSWLNSVLTVIFGCGLGVAAFELLRFVFVTARWKIIQVNLTNLMVGLFPRAEVPRAWVALFVLAAVISFVVGMSIRINRLELAAKGEERARHSFWEDFKRSWPVLLLLIVLASFSGSWLVALWIVLLVVTVLVFRFVGARVPVNSSRWILVVANAGILAAFLILLLGPTGVGWEHWGGLMLTVFLAAAGIILSFPLGVLLALGRRSTLPLVRIGCVVYIELIRGVPLVTLLFMGSLMIGFFLPPDAPVLTLVMRALIAIVLFTAAYLAEIVRGGLQAVPTGQIEASQALGMPAIKTLRLIVLPQAFSARKN